MLAVLFCLFAPNYTACLDKLDFVCKRNFQIYAKVFINKIQHFIQKIKLVLDNNQKTSVLCKPFHNNIYIKQGKIVFRLTIISCKW